MNFTFTTDRTPTTGKEMDEEPLVLKRMNDDELQRLIPTIVFLAVISLLGIFGNGVVCHVYRTKYRLSNSQCFILCLGAIDLITCSIAIPFEITTIIDQYTFTELWLCKLSRFFNTIGTMSSSFLLLVIAIDRYRKVCKPFGWQISSKVAKILCGISILFGFVLALPAVFIYGKQTFEIDGMAINGTECSTDDKMASTMFPFLNAAVFATLFLTGIVTICMLYCFIGAEVKRHANTMPGQYSRNRNGSIPMVSALEDGRNSRMSGELIHEINEKPNRASKRRSKYRMSKVKKSESDLSWNAANEDLSFSMECTATETLQRGTNMELGGGGVKISDNVDECNTDSEDSGIKSDQIIHENTDLEQLETNDTVTLEDEKGVDTNQESQVQEEPDQCPDILKEESDSIRDLIENQQDLDESQTAKIITKDTQEDAKDDLDVPSLGNSPAISDEQMGMPNKYAKNGRSMSRLSSIGSRISNAIRRMTSVTSVTSSLTIRKTQYLKQARARKTAFLMFMISLAFVLSYLPHLLLMFLRQLDDDFVDDLSDQHKAVYKFFLRSYFLNSAINPIIYGVCDTRFRTACKELFSCCFEKQTE